MWKNVFVTAILTVFIVFNGQIAEAAGNADKGKKVFNLCKACHTLKAGKHRVGPSLNGVFNRKAGTAKGFEKRYSKAMKKAGDKGVVWNAENLSTYLIDPKKFLRKATGNPQARGKMPTKVRNAKKRDDLIAYLKQATK